MSGWTVITVRGRESSEYERSRYDDGDRWQATSDLVATFDEDRRIRQWTTHSGHVYGYLNTGRYEFGYAEELLEDYSKMIDDAVVLGANDTSDTGTAKYYTIDRWGTDDTTPRDVYRESQAEDGTLVGEKALAIMFARHNIDARDPFHNEAGLLDDKYNENGVDYSNQ